MAASADIARVYGAGVEPVFTQHEVAAGATLYEGEAVALDGTTNRADSTAALDGLIFAGFAVSKADNSAGAAGAINVNCRARGIVKLDITDGTAGTNVDVGETVYASDDNTFLSADSGTAGTSDMTIGKVHQVLSTSGTTATCMVYFEAASLRSL